MTTRENDLFLAALEPILQHHRPSAERNRHLTLLKAMRLAPTLHTAIDLLNGTPVPPSKLDQQWAREYGLL